MCGIIGYVGGSSAEPILVEGLRRLEYRGYDSAGLAICNGGVLTCTKVAGKIARLEEEIDGRELPGQCGIAHTRWATHGPPTQDNAHPHTDCSGKIALVHNGIIENYAYLKDTLEKEGHVFTSETDSEVLVHLIEKYFKGNLESAVQQALQWVTGTYGIGVVAVDDPGKIVGARNGSPLVVGIGNGEYFLASDVPAILRHTRQVIYLDDQELVVLTKDGLRTSTIADNEAVTKIVQEISWDVDRAEKEGYAHFMLKEIYEQARTVSDAISGRTVQDDGTARLGGLNLTDEQLRSTKRVIITACGTSFHAGLIGEYMLEEWARIPVEVEYASEFRYRNPVIEDGTLCIVISQSGETADTLAAMREARRRGARALGICNVVGSMIAREADGGVYIHAGPEIGVASTKAFTSQVVVLSLITLLMGRMRHMSVADGQRTIAALRALPGQIQTILEQADEIKRIAKIYCEHDNFLYLGRGCNYPVALEGALKLKEISYIHAEGYPAAEMKHGPIALITKHMPVVVIATKDSAYEKVMGNLSEVKARRGRILAIATEGDSEIKNHAEHVFYIPPTLQALTPVLSVIPLQLLAYYIAVMRECNVDQPRNLAKSVTVE
ncbi:MAG: glutamine--fructose-6-phosphate transaminase (isomerizing) [Candidatus Eisenbacteria sp.]|nr:glutamine--fructose-6-phosphate transaminase (isomerizing) [Candidatus Eisenbacteria bacterium]